MDATALSVDTASPLLCARTVEPEDTTVAADMSTVAADDRMAERATTAAFRPPELWDPLHFAAASAATKNSSGKTQRREVSGSADVWSLGASLFACLGDGDRAEGQRPLSDRQPVLSFLRL